MWSVQPPSTLAVADPTRMGSWVRCVLNNRELNDLCVFVPPEASAGSSTALGTWQGLVQ